MTEPAGPAESDAELTEQNVLDCCASKVFAQLVIAGVGATCKHNLKSVFIHARELWWNQTPISGWLEAFAAHPRIGDMNELRARFGTSAASSREEQAQAAEGASDEVLQELARKNEEYFEKFKFIFIICATGSSAVRMLDELKRRCLNSPVEELMTAAAEQMKITEIRMRRLFISKGWPLDHDGAAAPAASAASRAGVRTAPGPGRGPSGRAAAQAAPSGAPERPPITTHVLDIAAGRPAARVKVHLHIHAPGSGLHRSEPGTGNGAVWELLADSETGQDGRCTDLLPAGYPVEGVYRLTFGTARYQAHATLDGAPAQTGVAETLHKAEAFFPQASVMFRVERGQHYHVPLTWSPFGYSTYRGS
ncbi:hypothetical protein WJX81_004533 [Elliptochloris bilobata]|uniref:Hydroxyisourate hydrolase n=1 Tax=Elliptochloris bilobata TaxID=381761 RepID=A0AAW1RYD9_9CHLO